MARLLRVCLACVALFAHHGNAMSADQKLMMEHFIKDAGASQLTSSGPNATPGCVWPACATYCVKCASGNPDSSCQASSPVNQCLSGSSCIGKHCYCSPGQCWQDGLCKTRQCFMGATPPAFEATKAVDFYLGWAPEIPRAGAPLVEWQDWASSCTRGLPLLVLTLGCVVALPTCICLAGNLEERCCSCAWLPRSPIVLIAIGVLCIFATVVGMGVRMAIVTESMDTAEQELARAVQTMEETQTLMRDVIAAKNSFVANLAAAPGTCNSDLMKNLVNATAFETMDKAIKMSQPLVLMEDLLTDVLEQLKLFQDNYWSQFKLAVLWGPLVPLILTLAVMSLIVAVTSISWCSRNPEVSEYADDVMLRFGSVGIALLIITCTAFASGALWMGTLTSGFCVNVDANLLAVAKEVNFAKVAHDSLPINPLISGAVEYYLADTRENPMHVLLSDAEATAQGLQTEYNAIKFKIDMALPSCPGLSTSSPSKVVESTLASIEKTRKYTEAAQLWPYYNTMVHRVMCTNAPRNQAFMISYTLIFGLLVFPLMAIWADIDLRKWANHKEDNFEHHFGKEKLDDSVDSEDGEMS